jgi:hypothetical protein
LWCTLLSVWCFARSARTLSSRPAAGGFRARVKVADNWGASYNVVVGVGDITGDGRADIVSRDTSGKL